MRLNNKTTKVKGNAHVAITHPDFGYMERYLYDFIIYNYYFDKKSNKNPVLARSTLCSFLFFFLACFITPIIHVYNLKEKVILRDVDLCE